MNDSAPQDPPLSLAMDLGHRISQASSTGLPTPELCCVVVDVAIGACRASGMDKQAVMELFDRRASRPIYAVADGARQPPP